MVIKTSPLLRDPGRTVGWYVVRNGVLQVTQKDVIQKT